MMLILTKNKKKREIQNLLKNQNDIDKFCSIGLFAYASAMSTKKTNKTVHKFYRFYNLKIRPKNQFFFLKYQNFQKMCMNKIVL